MVFVVLLPCRAKGTPKPKSYFTLTFSLYFSTLASATPNTYKHLTSLTHNVISLLTRKIMSSPQPKLSPETLWDHIDYCTVSGQLSLKADAPHPKINQFFTDCIWVDGHNYTFPRLAFYMHNGYLPKRLVRIGNALDMRVENLQAYEPKQVVIAPRKRETLFGSIPSAPVKHHPTAEVRATLRANKIEQQKLKAETALAKRRAKARAIYLKKLESEGKQLHPLTQLIKQ